MFFSKSTMQESRTQPTPALRGHDHSDLPVDDPPPAEHPAEQYQSWRATAIYHLAPFSAR